MDFEKHKIKIKDFKKFILSISVTVLILILLSSVIYNLIHYKKFNKPSNSEKNILQKNLTVKKNNSEIKDNSKIKKNNKDETLNVIISSVGDCTIGTDSKLGYQNSLPCILQENNNDLSYFFKNVRNIFKEDNFTTANLETTFTNAEKRSKKAYNFKAKPYYAKSLKLGCIDAVNLSNNHTYDYLEKGIEDTKNALKNADVLYFGDGEILTSTINGEKFAFLGYEAWSDTDKFLNNIKNDITSLKNKNYTVIVNFHWGIEKDYTPCDVQKNIAHSAIDYGADLIIGHHPHVIQTVERYKNKIICYSLGNFCFGGNFNPKDKDTFIFQAKFNFKNHKLINYDTKFIPCSISSIGSKNDYCPTILMGSEKERVLQKLKNLSPTYADNIQDKFLSVSNYK